MELALRAVVSNRMSFDQAVEAYGIPRTTLYNKYRGNHSDKLDKPSVFSTLEEKTITLAALWLSTCRLYLN